VGRESSLREGCAVANHGGPLADTPGFHEAVSNVRIGLRERFGRLRGGTAKNQHGSVSGIRQGTGHYQLAAIVGLSDQGKMLGAKRTATVDVIVHHVIEEEEVRGQDTMIVGREPRTYSMKAKLRLLSAFLLLAMLATAQRAMTVADVIAFVDSQIKLKGDDKATADFLQHIKLTQKLEPRDVENLQARGAGVRTLQVLRKLSEDSASLAAAPPPPEPPPPTPPPSAKEQAAILAAIKEYALSYTKNLPNYVCVQITRRRIEPTQSGYLPQGDEVQELLSFVDGKESYKVEAINGKSEQNKKHEELGGVVTSGEFGRLMSSIFDPESGTEFHWDHWAAALRGKPMYVFGYSVPQSNGYSMYHGESKREYTSAYKGLIYADLQSKAVMRITLETVGIPADFPIHEVKITLDYNPTKIADQEYVLPYRFELTSKEVRAETTNRADYRLYQKFGAESGITFGDIAPIPEDQFKEQPAAPAQKAAPAGKKK